MKDPKIFELEKELDDLKVISEIDLAMLVKFSSAVIGHHSSTMLTPIVLNKPLFIPKWGVMEYLNDRFSKNDVAFPAESPDQLIEYLNDVNNKKFEMKETALRTKYFEDFISIKDGKSIKRIVKNIISVADLN